VTSDSSGTASIEASEQFTIDELAARTGMTVRTVRFYASQGLLAPPVRQGRMAYYNSDHRLRLEFIRELQDYGYTLASIEGFLSRIPAGTSANEFAVHRAMVAPWTPQGGLEVDRQALERRAGQALDDDAIDFLGSIGVVEPLEEGRFRISPATFAIGIDVLRMNIPRTVLTEASQVLTEHAAAAAESLSDVFRRGIWEPYLHGDLDEVAREHLGVAVHRLRTLALQGLVTAFEQAADRAIREPRAQRRPT